MQQLGLGVMINMLGGNESTINALKACLGVRIEKVWLDEESNHLRFLFKNGVKMSMWDNGQSCCENRYMRTDDDLSEFTNTIFKDIEIADAPSIDDGGECHDVQFLRIHTGKGIFVMSNHNEHNGYYGGFSIVASLD